MSGLIAATSGPLGEAEGVQIYASGVRGADVIHYRRERRRADKASAQLNAFRPSTWILRPNEIAG
jgi:hypothetical protein